MTSLKILIEKHADGFIAYPLGIRSVVVGEGDSYEEALNNVRNREYTCERPPASFQPLGNRFRLFIAGSFSASASPP